MNGSEAMGEVIYNLLCQEESSKWSEPIHDRMHDFVKDGLSVDLGKLRADKEVWDTLLPIVTKLSQDRSAWNNMDMPKNLDGVMQGLREALSLN